MSGGETCVAVEVVRAGAGGTLALDVSLPAGATVRDALLAVASALGVDDIDALADQVGVFGERCALQRRVAEGDRIEVYRPLLLDPKGARRLRAERAAKRAGRPRDGR